MLKHVYIMRGIPGSGKSTVAGLLARHAENRGLEVATHSTDDLCMVDGEYRFDPALAPERHEQNFENFKGSLKEGVPSIIVDNTNVKVEYYGHYVEEAKAAGYQVVIVELVHPTLDLAVERNSHGVPREVINQMILDWEPAQHCVTVDNVIEAVDTLIALQSHAKGLMALSFSAGSTIGAVIVALAWLVSP